MVRPGTKVVIAALFGALASCSLHVDVGDISEVELSFESPPQNLYSNKTNYNFGVKLDTDNSRLSLAKAKLHVFEDENCAPDTIVETRSLDPQSRSALSGRLENGKRYSARVTLEHEGRKFQSVCSPWVGIDFDNPTSVSVQYPAADQYVTSKQLLAAWSQSMDIGISGLREKPYILRLYTQPHCAGEVSQQVDSRVEQYLFENLTHGVVYSVKVTAIDQAGNESHISCSPYTEIDLYAPGFQLKDPSSVPGYSRVLSPEISFANDSHAAYWCITPDLTYRPASLTETCPGGTGPSNGWYTSRPTHLPLTPTEGLKNFNLWAFRGNGTLLSQNVTSAAITLDRTLPGAFSLSGVVSENHDLIVDTWLTSEETPVFLWSSSTDATDYSVQVLNSANSIVCEKTGILPTTRFSFTECEGLTDQHTYSVFVRSYDVARNVMNAPVFYFTVDRLAPGNFTISGMNGGDDITVDSFVGSGLPVVHFTSAADTHRYEVEIKDANDLTVCAPGSKAAPTNTFGYADEGLPCVLVHGGDYRAYVTAFDEGLNKTAASNNGFAFTVDTQPPNLSLDAGPATLTQSTSASFSFSASDALSGLRATECSLDGGSFISCSSGQTYNLLGEGPHTFQVKAIDFAGNETLRSQSWTVDLTNPVLTLHTQPPAVSNQTAASVTFSATDTNSIAQYQCSLNGAAFVSCNGSFDVTVGQGPHFIVVRAYDPLGWYDEKSAHFLVDLTAPTTTILTQPTAITASENPSFTFSSVDTGGAGLSGHECSWDDGPYTPCTSPTSRTNFADGSHVFAVRARDAAGNVGVPATYSWIVHTTGPVMAWDAVPAARNNLTATSAAFHGTTISGLTITGYECSLDGEPYASCSSAHNLTSLVQQNHTLSVRAIDSLGIRGAAISTSWFTDLTGPVTTLSSGPSGFQAANSASFVFTALDAEGSGVSGYQCSLNLAAYVPCASGVSYSSLSEGPQSFSVRAVDGLGNIGSAVTRTWTTDYTAPTVTITGGPANPTHASGSASIIFTGSDASGISARHCSLDGGPFEVCTSPVSYSGLGAGNHAVTVRVTDGVGRTSTATHSWTIYTYSWSLGPYGACDAAQPSYAYGAFGACSVAQPAFVYGDWGGCSATCGGGVQYRSQSCNYVYGTQTRSYSCPTTSGNQYRTVSCIRNGSTTVADSFCTSYVSAKPTTLQSCTRNDCTGTPVTSQGCSRGGGSDCHTLQDTARSCNTQGCWTYWRNNRRDGAGLPYCSGGQGSSCSSYGHRCLDPGDGWQLQCQ